MQLQLQQRVGLRLQLSEQIGEIPLYSLHRLKRLLDKNAVGLSDELNIHLKRLLIEANADYQEETGNAWYCLTSDCLVSVMKKLDDYIQGVIPRDNGAATVALNKFREKTIEKIRDFFHDRFEDIEYSTNSKIPFAVVQRLRKNMKSWSLKTRNPFTQVIEDMIIEVAKAENIAETNPETAWRKMGGTTFFD